MRVASLMAVYWKRLIVAPVLALKEEKELDVKRVGYGGRARFLVPRRMRRCGQPCRKSAYAMALEDAINPCVRNLDVMITGEVPDDPHRPQMIGPPQVERLGDKRPPAFGSGVTLALSSSEGVER